ncbi:hypothetical protein BAE30_16555 [Acidithiobacillus caldus]|uniref:Uncharacterized protein n=1 Tax=Acidithiobacillus caldus TaxID=33059 RepID=A0A1E7YRH0_9PROT|nr:hypothetical protein BAE30_16555 [Acidithiobacillus caldus]
MAQTPEEIQTVNTPLDDNANKAIKHQLDAIRCLQQITCASVEDQESIADTFMRLRFEVVRLIGRGHL